MKIKIKHKKVQKKVALFGGRLHENKPLAGEPVYSNLVYWAQIEASRDGTFPLHPHKGVEILTFVLSGQLEHFDTTSKRWTRLAAGGVQQIRSGRGVSHSEKFAKGSRAFQIWLDPDFSKSMKMQASYKEFQPNRFSWRATKTREVMAYTGKKGPLKLDTPGVSIKRYKLPKGEHELGLQPDATYSLYLINGALALEHERNQMVKDSFAKIKAGTSILLNVSKESDLFVLQSPTLIGYQRTYS